MAVLEQSNDLLHEPGALRARLESEGYIFLRGVFDRGAVHRVKTGLMQWLVGTGLAIVRDDEAYLSGPEFTGIDDDPAELYQLGLWQDLVNDPSVRATLDAVFNEQWMPLPLTHYRFTPPGHRIGITHQDAGTNPSSALHLTCWTPLASIDQRVGGLRLAPGYHRRGLLYPPVKQELAEPGAKQVEGVQRNNSYRPPEPNYIIPDSDWASTEYEPGDVIIFTGTTPHQGLANRSDRFRLSVDFRVSLASNGYPTIGTVLDVNDREITLRDSSGTRTFAISRETVFRLGYFTLTRPRLDLFIGRTTIVEAAENRAELVRLPVPAAVDSA